MYRVPKDLDIKDIIGCDLDLLGIGGYDVQLNFSGSSIKICTQGSISLLQKNQIIATWDEEKNWSSLEFQKLLNARVESYSVPDENTLEIKFKDDLVLQIHDDSDQYEAMQIYFDDKNKPAIII